MAIITPSNVTDMFVLRIHNTTGAVCVYLVCTMPDKIYASDYFHWYLQMSL